jgi:hypothetical protein
MTASGDETLLLITQELYRRPHGGVKKVSTGKGDREAVRGA